MINEIVYWCSSIFQVYNLYLLVHCFFNKPRVSRKKEFMLYIILFIMISVPYRAFSVPILTLICSLLSEVLITFAYEGTKKKRILAGFLIYLYMALVETIIAIIFGYMNPNIFENTEYFTLFGTLCLPFVENLFIRIIRNLRNIKSEESMPLGQWAITLLLPTASMYLLCLFLMQPSLRQSELIGCVVSIFVVNIFVFILYDHQLGMLHTKRERDILKLQTQYQQNQFSIMEKSISQLQQQQHDFKKHISMISYSLTNESKEQTMAYVQELEGELIQKGSEFICTGNRVIDSILNYRLQDFGKLHVAPQIDVCVPEDLQLSFYDMNILLTNLLDNAYEALENVEENERTLQIQMNYKKDSLQIVIENPYHGKIDFQGGSIASQKLDKTEHGFGLKNVNTIVEKYNGVMEINLENQIFKVDLCLFIEK